VTGPLSDVVGRKPLIVGGMVVQAVGIWLTLVTRSFAWWLTGSVLLGVGTAMVYPALMPLSAMQPLQPGAREVSASIASGATWDMLLEHCWLVLSPTCLASIGQSAS
jgi:MFS family permease